MKKIGSKIGGDFKIVGNKVVKDEAAISARLDVSKRITRRKSKRVKIVKRTEQNFGG